MYIYIYIIYIYNVIQFLSLFAPTSEAVYLNHYSIKTSMNNDYTHSDCEIITRRQYKPIWETQGLYSQTDARLTVRPREVLKPRC